MGVEGERAEDATKRERRSVIERGEGRKEGSGGKLGGRDPF